VCPWLEEVERGYLYKGESRACRIGSNRHLGAGVVRISGWSHSSRRGMRRWLFRTLGAVGGGGLRSGSVIEDVSIFTVFFFFFFFPGGGWGGFLVPTKLHASSFKLFTSEATPLIPPDGTPELGAVESEVSSPSSSSPLKPLYIFTFLEFEGDIRAG